MDNWHKPAFFQQESGRNDRWLTSYVDVVTILLILFVAAAAQGVQRAVAKPVPAVPPAVRPATPPPSAPPPAISAALQAAKESLEEQGMDVEVRDRGLVVSLPQAVLFASGEDHITASALPAVARIARVLHDIPATKVTLTGHADATPVHGARFHSNWELSAARSLRLLELLTERYGIAEDRLSISSQGSQSPKSPNDTEYGRAANRRVEILIQGD